MIKLLEEMTLKGFLQQTSKCSRSNLFKRTQHCVSVKKTKGQRSHKQLVCIELRWWGRLQLAALTSGACAAHVVIHQTAIRRSDYVYTQLILRAKKINSHLLKLSILNIFLL